MNFIYTKFALLGLMFSFQAVGSELQVFRNVTYVPETWADGDSFRVRFADGELYTVRLYGVDCMEWKIHDNSDARRLRAQRRYFGISNHGGSPSSSIELGKKVGEAAAKRVRTLLSKPFTVHTAFADGRGDARYKRIYGFVTTAEGKDLGQVLVAEGLARAYGVYRRTPDGRTREEYREELRDTELIAARTSAGVWQFTDWSRLPEERREQRMEEREDRLAMETAQPSGTVDINQASRDELMQIPGIGDVTATAIIEERPFKTVEDLTRVRGIGPKTLEKIKPWVTVLP